MNPKKCIVVSLVLLSGCTATQLRYQTLNQAETVESITDKQIFFNLEKFDKNPYAFPSQVTVIAGSASTTDSVSPTFMTPLGMSTMVTSQVANMANSSVATALATTTANSVATAAATGTSSTTTNGSTAMTTNTTGSTVTTGATNTIANATQTATAIGTSNSVATGTTGGTTTTTTNGTTGGNTTTNTTGTTGGTTDSTASTRPNRSLSLALSDNWMESWTLDPVVNPDVLRRLSALYRYVLGESDAAGDALDKDKKGFPDRQKLKAWVASDPKNKNAVEDQFMCEYALPQAAPGGGASGSTATTTTTQTFFGGTTTTTTIAPEAPAEKDDQSVTLVFRCLVNSDGKYHKRALKVKRSTLGLPGCVICLDEAPPTGPEVIDAFHPGGGTDAQDYSRPYVNPNLHFGFIVHVRDDGHGNSNPHLGRAFYGDVAVEKNTYLAFHEFESLVNAATIVDSTSGTTGGAKGSNPKVLAVPVSPNGFLLK